MNTLIFISGLGAGMAITTVIYSLLFRFAFKIKKTTDNEFLDIYRKLLDCHISQTNSLSEISEAIGEHVDLHSP